MRQCFGIRSIDTTKPRNLQDTLFNLSSHPHNTPPEHLNTNVSSAVICTFNSAFSLHECRGNIFSRSMPPNNIVLQPIVFQARLMCAWLRPWVLRYCKMENRPGTWRVGSLPAPHAFLPIWLYHRLTTYRRPFSHQIC